MFISAMTNTHKTRNQNLHEYKNFKHLKPKNINHGLNEHFAHIYNLKSLKKTNTYNIKKLSMSLEIHCLIIKTKTLYLR